MLSKNYFELSDLELFPIDFYNQIEQFNCEFLSGQEKQGDTKWDFLPVNK